MLLIHRTQKSPKTACSRAFIIIRNVSLYLSESGLASLFFYEPEIQECACRQYQCAGKHPQLADVFP